MSRSTKHRSHNLAARMGRWSAAHWKTATFGWLALRRRRLRARRHGRDEEHRPTTRRTRRVGPHGQDPRGRVQAARRRERPDPESLGSCGHARLRRRGRGRRRACLEDRGGPGRPLAARSRQRRPDLEERALRARRVRDPGRQGRTRSTRSTPSSTAVAAAQRAHPGFTIGEFGDASAEKGVVDGVRRTTSARPGRSRSRSRSSSSCSRSARSWQRASRSCSR